MHPIKKAIMSVAALAALALGGAQIAAATGDDAEQNDGPDHALTGASADRAGEAARGATGGGSVRSVERDDESSGGGYEVKLEKGGKIIEVKVSGDYRVTGQQPDDDQDRGDGDGETNDDG